MNPNNEVFNEKEKNREILRSSQKYPVHSNEIPLKNHRISKTVNTGVGVKNQFK